MAEKKETKKVEAVKVEETTLEKRVPVFIPRRSQEEENYLMVAINGKKWQIKKDVTVYVPESVAEVIEHSQAEDQALSEKLDALVGEED